MSVVLTMPFCCLLVVEAAGSILKQSYSQTSSRASRGQYWAAVGRQTQQTKTTRKLSSVLQHRPTGKLVSFLISRSVLFYFQWLNFLARCCQTLLTRRGRSTKGWSADTHPDWVTFSGNHSMAAGQTCVGKRQKCSPEVLLSLEILSDRTDDEPHLCWSPTSYWMWRQKTALNCDTNTGWLPQDSYFITFQRSCKSQKFFSIVARLGKNLLQSSWSRHRSEPPFQQPEGCQALFVLHSCFHTVYNLRPVYKDAPHTYTRKTRWWSDGETEELPCFVVFGWTTRTSFKKESCVRRFMRNWRWTENMYSWRAFDVKDEKHNVAQQLVVHWRKACKAAPNKIPTVTELPRVQVQVMCVFFVSYPITAKCQEKLIKLHLLVP